MSGVSKCCYSEVEHVRYNNYRCKECGSFCKTIEFGEASYRIVRELKNRIEKLESEVKSVSSVARHG